MTDYAEQLLRDELRSKDRIDFYEQGAIDALETALEDYMRMHTNWPELRED